MDASTPPKKLRVAKQQPSYAIPVHIQLDDVGAYGALEQHFFIKTLVPRDELDMLAARVAKVPSPDFAHVLTPVLLQNVNSARPSKFGWTKCTRGDQTAAWTNFTVQVYALVPAMS